MSAVTTCQKDETAPLSKTTVIITTHNYGQYIVWCISSVLAQSVRPARIIVVDDASDDCTKEILSNSSLDIDYYRVEYKNSQKARNFGLTKAVSEFVLFLDADDFMSDQMIEKLERALCDHPKARVAYCDKFVFGDVAAIQRLQLPYYWKAPSFSIKHLRFKNFIMLPSLVRREFHTGFDTRIRRLQDWDSWLSITTCDEHAIHVGEPLLHYRVHGHNLSIKYDELIERLKILLKHRLIEAKQFSPVSAPEKLFSGGLEIVVMSLNPELAYIEQWQRLTPLLGCRVRVIVGDSFRGATESSLQETIIRNGSVILQTTKCYSLDELFRRYSGVISSPDVAGIAILNDLNSESLINITGQSDGASFRSNMNLDEILDAASLEALGTFVLSTSAMRLLLYLPPVSPPTMTSRIRHSASRLISEHLTWRIRRKK